MLTVLMARPYSSASSMWRGRRPSVCLHALWPARNQEARTQERGLLPLPTHLPTSHLAAAAGSRVQTVHQHSGAQENAHGRVMIKNCGNHAGKCPQNLCNPLGTAGWWKKIARTGSTVIQNEDSWYEHFPWCLRKNLDLQFNFPNFRGSVYLNIKLKTQKR